MSKLVVLATVLSLALTQAVTSAFAVDCNANGIPDAQELAGGTQTDCNANTILDVCETEVEFETTELDDLIFFGYDVVATDLDGDGDADVAGIEYGSPPQDFISKVWWFENLDGAGTFGAGVEIWSGNSRPESIHAADLNGDDDVDLLMTMIDMDAIAWFENLGPGTFSALQTISTTLVDPRAAVAADVDGDGHQDVVAAFTGDRGLVWYASLDGLGSFGPPQTITSNVALETVLTADIDGDGDSDIVTDGPMWFENSDGAGTFLPRGTIAFSSKFPRSYAAADLDGDRDVDLVFAGDEVGWQENEDGEGDFGLANVWNLIDPDTDFIWSVTAADFDADGDNDVITAAFGGGEIAWYENLDGLGTFSGRRHIFADIKCLSVVHADVDGDGDLDAVSSSSGQFNFHRNLSDDCNGNRSPDECETFVDCNLNEVMDSCDIALRTSFDCDNNVVPDECEVACPGGGCDADGDGCFDVLDCAPADASAWSVPGEVTDVRLSHSDFGVTTVSWSAPFHRGSIDPVVYDALISPTPDDFVGNGSCLATDILPTSRSHFFNPTSGQRFHFLIRGGNDCGEGPLGIESSSVARDGVACP